MNRNSKWILPLVISAILGIIVGIFIFNGTISIALIGTPIIFATLFAGISLILLFIGAAFGVRKETKNNIRIYGNQIILGTSGTLVTGFLGLIFVTNLIAESLLPALLIAFGVFFFVFNYISLIALIVELVNDINIIKEDYCNYNER